MLLCGIAFALLPVYFPYAPCHPVSLCTAEGHAAWKACEQSLGPGERSRRYAQ